MHDTPWFNPRDSSLYNHARPIIVNLEPGETLYLPALWYHSVLQTNEVCDGFSGTVAVNWWYDMDYGSQYVLVDLIKKFGRVLEFGQDWEKDRTQNSNEKDDDLL